MRPSLVPGLAAAAQRNADRGYGDIALFEVGQIYAGDGPADQADHASGIRRGTARFDGAGRVWDGATADVRRASPTARTAAAPPLPPTAPVAVVAKEAQSSDEFPPQSQTQLLKVWRARCVWHLCTVAQAGPSP